MKMKIKRAPGVTWRTTFCLILSLCAGLTLSANTAAQNTDPNPLNRSRANFAADYPALAKYATDISNLPNLNNLEQIGGHEADIARVIACLARESKAPLLLGELDFDRNVVARSIALRIASGDVPEGLRGKRVFSLSLDALAKNAKTSEEFSNRFQAVMADATKAANEIILFIDQVHQYAGPRAALNASGAVRNAIENSHLQIIGAASAEVYANYIASDAGIA